MASRFASAMLGIAGITIVLAVLVIAFHFGAATESQPMMVSQPALSSPVVVHVRAVLNLPTETPKPTKTPEAVATKGAGVDFCSATPEAGKLCAVPPAPPATPTNYPDCRQMESLEPQDLCRWPTEEGEN